MSESTTTEAQATEQQQAAPPQGGEGPKTFTQEEVNAIVERRVARVKAQPPADYEDLKAKAAKYDELEAANKSEVERANDAAAKSEAKAEEWKLKYEELEAEKARAAEVAAKAAEHGVDADMLARMSGDVEANALFLKAREDARPKFGDMSDGGEQPSAAQTLEDIRAIRNPSERVRARAEYISTHKQ